MKSTANSVLTRPTSDVAVSTYDAVRQVLLEVESNEAKAISLLVSLLDRVRETSDTTPLKGVAETIVQWQNVPPDAIVRSLEDIEKQWDSTRKGQG